MPNCFQQFLAAVCGVAMAAIVGCSKPATSPAQSASAPASAPTLILRNANIITMNPAQPRAQAIAIQAGRIVAVGTNDQIQPYADASADIIDLHGQTAVPGLIEGHGHFMNLGVSKVSLDLSTAKNWDEIVAQVADAVKKAKPGDWIIGRGWHQEKWDKPPTPNIQGFPLHDSLSKISPDNPVFLAHASSHASYVNAKAMELAGITAATPNPSGGDIIKDAAGRPIGVLREAATALATNAFNDWNAKRTPEAREADTRLQIKLAVDDALANGISTFEDAGSDFPTLDTLKKALDEGLLRVRLWVMVRDTNANMRAKLPSYIAVGLGDQHLTIGAIKKQMDGALGSRGAWFLEPYSDFPGSTGIPLMPISELKEAAQIALDNHVQLCVHAIGDRANREVLDVYEAAFKSRPELTDLRWRIEHAQHLNPADIPRFGKLGIIASMQGIHATSDAPFVIARIGQQRAEEGAYVWQKLMQSGALISNGTDTPVERINPIANFYSSVTRKTKDGTTFFPDQRMTREEALKSQTINAAFAAREEKIKGSLEVGKLGDVTVLSNDILTIAEDQILSTKVIYTIVGGKIEYH